MQTARRPLPYRHQIVWASPNFPNDHRLRTGAFDRGRHCRRPRGCCRACRTRVAETDVCTESSNQVLPAPGVAGAGTGRAQRVALGPYRLQRSLQSRLRDLPEVTAYRQLRGFFARGDDPDAARAINVRARHPWSHLGHPPSAVTQTGYLAEMIKRGSAFRAYAQRFKNVGFDEEAQPLQLRSFHSISWRIWSNQFRIRSPYICATRPSNDIF